MSVNALKNIKLCPRKEVSKSWKLATKLSSRMKEISDTQMPFLLQCVQNYCLHVMCNFLIEIF